MREFINIIENVHPTLKDFVTVKTGDPDADFWITRRSGVDQVGQPVETFNPEAFGIKVIRTDVLQPRFLYYMMTHLWMQGVWKQVATGATKLVSIRAGDILNIPLK